MNLSLLSIPASDVLLSGFLTLIHGVWVVANAICPFALLIGCIFLSRKLKPTTEIKGQD